MTKRELEEVFYLEKEIKDLNKRISRIEKITPNVADVVQNGYKRHSVIYGIDVKRAYKLQRLNEKLKKFNISLVEQRQKALDYIQNVPFSEIRQIMTFRYVDGFSWIKVAHEMNRLYPNEIYSKDSVRGKCERFLEKK